MSHQCTDLGLSYRRLEEKLVATGYWADAERRRRNAFVLSPAAYVVGPRQHVALETLARALYASIERAAHDLTRIAQAKSRTHAEAFFVSSVRNCIRSLRAPHEHDGSIPPVIKVDLMQDTEGRFMIAEADTYNPRGFGYLSLMESLLPEDAACVGPGIRRLAEHVRARIGDETLRIIVSNHEQYYLPSYEILAAGLRTRGTPTEIVTEKQLAGSETLASTLGSILILPDSLYKAPRVRDVLLARIADGSLVSVYPPAAYLGSKALLPAYAACEIVNRFLPPTRLVSRRDGQDIRPDGAPRLLKGTGSSGHKNIVFSSREPGRFAETLREARTLRHPAWIVQEEVQQARMPVVVFDEGGRRVTKEYVLRLTAYIERDGLLGIEATGRQDGFVHGAPDCIMLPCVLG